ncbi:hypothetical protein F5Y00DRAFT_272463 [Daldinia vernicosa]|uniref:uncharacterized protein n=1 Tax=Daldinia vernicosa TaxID=114800 RepID=UPI002008E41E|nr:uncharacterized protein F5Y00DRAFT_272463 [Daldinia vernicosa]KAI0852834.1 hypothetical protein F5Y00DRAFT_272463 [Daldinia vernicosa]
MASTASLSNLSLDSLILETPPEKKQSIFRRIFTIISTQWTRTYRETWSDLRSVRWARGGLWTLFTLWTMAVLGFFVFITLYNSIDFYIYGGSACRTDGSFVIDTSDYSIWTSSSFFDISLGFGNLTFAEAKVIDISWDIVIGRGGQALMAFMSWRVFADYVTTSMEFAPVTFTVFSIIFLQDEPSFFSTISIIRAFISGRGLKSKVAMVFMVLTMVFIIAWPTVAGAMTGYTTIGKAFVPDIDNNYISYSSFKPLAYIVHDGGRVNLTSNYISFVPEQSHKESIFYYGSYFDTCYFKDDYIESDCWLQSNVSTYVASYGFYGLKNTPSRWMNTTIPSPTLNISAFYIPDFSRFYGFNWSGDPGTGHTHEFANRSNMAFFYSNNTYSLDYVTTNGRCQPIQDRFKWGFSCIQLFLVLAFLSIETIGIYLLRLKAQFQLPLQGEVETYRGWRAVLTNSSRLQLGNSSEAAQSRSTLHSPEADIASAMARGNG